MVAYQLAFTCTFSKWYSRDVRIYWYTPYFAHIMAHIFFPPLPTVKGWPTTQIDISAQLPRFSFLWFCLFHSPLGTKTTLVNGKRGRCVRHSPQFILLIFSLISALTDRLQPFPTSVFGISVNNSINKPSVYVDPVIHCK